MGAAGGLDRVASSSTGNLRSNLRYEATPRGEGQWWVKVRWTESSPRDLGYEG